jgi:hypothetical protein
MDASMGEPASYLGTKDWQDQAKEGLHKLLLVIPAQAGIQFLIFLCIKEGTGFQPALE